MSYPIFVTIGMTKCMNFFLGYVVFEIAKKEEKNLISQLSIINKVLHFIKIGFVILKVTFWHGPIVN
jgi:hypothetical protein